MHLLLDASHLELSEVVSFGVVFFLEPEGIQAVLGLACIAAKFALSLESVLSIFIPVPPGFIERVCALTSWACPMSNTSRLWSLFSRHLSFLYMCFGFMAHLLFSYV